MSRISTPALMPHARNVLLQGPGAPGTIVLVLVSLAFGAAALASETTGTISGRVVDENGRPVPQATVLVVNKQRGGLTDSTGFYSVRAVPTGTHTVRAMQLGYSRDDRERIQVVAGKTTTVDFSLRSREADSSTPSPGTPLYTGQYWPCDPAWEPGPEEECLVQIGVHAETRGDTALYVYKVLNRSRYALNEIRIGNDGTFFDFTGASPHVVPDTAYGPPGWACTPVQGKDSTRFALAWKVVSGSGGGIPPDSASAMFRIALRKRDPLYAQTRWYARAEDAEFDGLVRPVHEVDAIPIEKGTIAGRVADQGDDALSGATISIRGTGLDVVSASNGTYTAPAVPVGTYTLVARASGHLPCGRTRIRVTAGGTTRVDFHLSTGALVISTPQYVTARERLDLPFPRDAVDTEGARWLKRGMPIPARSPGESSRPRPYLYSMTSRDIELVYRGLGPDTTTRAFEATVRREFRSPPEERLLRIAEETYPPTKAVASIGGGYKVKREDLLQEKRLWWYDEFDGVRLPYAVTMDAVRYYLGITQALGRGDASRTRGFRMIATTFSYDATVSPGPTTYKRAGHTFEDVYVVTMRLAWSDYCGNLCACGFGLDRTVVLRPDGTVVWVFGDRKPSVIVS
ncbi:MAG: carboxypeptidase-like regulatory domain-containing protein [Bacteroidota bacterium]